jgi:hypothetical protein
MDNKNELFDLVREKRELDAFLSSIAQDEAFEIFPQADGTALKEVLPSAVDGELQIQTSDEKPLVWSDDMTRDATPQEEVDAIDIDEFIPGRPTEKTGSEAKTVMDRQADKASSLFDFDDDQRPMTPRVVSAPSVKPLESFKTMTRYDGTVKYEGPPLTEASLDEERRSQALPDAGKRSGRENTLQDGLIEKKSGSDVYDFAPARKGGGKGKWVGLILVLLLVLAGGYFWFSSGSSVLGIGNIFKTGLSIPGGSAKEIKLINVRQRLVYNTQLGRSIRIIEGIAENTASFPVSEIKIAANLYNADGSLLVTKETIGGNILLDKQLGDLDESGLLSRLNKGKASTDIIPPGGHTPFMVIFTREMAGVHRLSVKVTDFVKH